MNRLDDDWLSSVGLSSMSPIDKNKFLAHCYATLETRVGFAIMGRLSGTQLEAFEQLVERGDDDLCLDFLNDQAPFYVELVHQEFERLTAEVRMAAPKLLGSVNSPRAGAT